MLWKRQNNRSAVVGLAAGPDGIAVAVIEEAAAGRPRVILCDHLGTLSENFTDFCKKHDLRQSLCVDVLHSEIYNLIQIDTLDAKGNEAREAVRWQIRELLDYPAEDAIVDLFEVPIVGVDENHKTFAVAARQQVLKERIALLEQFDLQLEAIDIPELALRNLLELFPDESRGLCLLWIRPESSLLIITRGETLYFSRLINIGMTQLFQNAESFAGGILSENLEILLDSVVLEIQRSLDYCESNFRLPPAPKIMVAMCGAEHQEVIDYIDRYLQAEVVSADFRRALDLPLEIDSPTINFCLAALGAALRAGGRE